MPVQQYSTDDPPDVYMLQDCNPIKRPRYCLLSQPYVPVGSIFDASEFSTQTKMDL